MTFEYRYYLAVFFRRFPYFFLVFCTAVAAALTAAFTLPQRYDSEARLLMETSQIPDELAAPTVNIAAREQLQIIEQRLLTRANLLDIANRLKVFPGLAQMSPDDIVEAMQNHTKIQSTAGRDQATLMRVAFQAETGTVAAAVVNEYITLILRDNVTIRTDRAQETLEFFQQEVDRLAVDLSDRSARILEFKNANTNALPDTLNFRLEHQSSLQTRLATVEQEIASLADQKRHLIQLFNATGQVETSRTDNRPPVVRQLDSLKEELNNALAIYSPKNPKVKLLQARVAQLEAAAAELGPRASGEQPSEELSLLEIQTSEIDNRIAVQNQQREQILAELERLKDSIARTATNSVALEQFTRDYTNVQMQYNSAIDRLAKASTGERIEVLSKGQRISVLDAAAVPNAPTSPNRPRIAALGVVVGLVLGGGLVVLLEMLNSAVRRPTDLVRHLEITPIIAVPYTYTRGEVVRSQLTLLLLLVIVLAGLPAMIYAVHIYYMPLDLLLDKIGDRIGL